MILHPVLRLGRPGSLRQNIPIIISCQNILSLQLFITRIGELSPARPLINLQGLQCQTKLLPERIIHFNTYFLTLFVSWSLLRALRIQTWIMQLLLLRWSVKDPEWERQIHKQEVASLSPEDQIWLPDVFCLVHPYFWKNSEPTF